MQNALHGENGRLGEKVEFIGSRAMLNFKKKRKKGLPMGVSWWIMVARQWEIGGPSAGLISHRFCLSGLVPFSCQQKSVRNRCQIGHVNSTLVLNFVWQNPSIIFVKTPTSPQPVNTTCFVCIMEKLIKCQRQMTKNMCWPEKVENLQIFYIVFQLVVLSIL